MAKKTSEKKSVSKKPTATGKGGASRAGGVGGSGRAAGGAASSKKATKRPAAGAAGKASAGKKPASMGKPSAAKSKVQAIAKPAAKASGKAARSGKGGSPVVAAKVAPVVKKKRGAVMSLRPKKVSATAALASEVEPSAVSAKEQRQAEKLAAKTAEKAAAKAVRKAEQADKLDSINTKIGEQQARARQFAIDAARIMDDLHCENVVVLDLTKKAATSDFVVLGTGTSDRQMRTCGEQVRDLAREQGHGETRMEADDRSTWIVAAAPEVVAHIFEPNTRAHYDLETMWGDVPRVDWKR